MTTGSNNGTMREAMPVTAAWIDSLRDAFGAEVINPMLKHMHAQEAGNTLGTTATHSIAGKQLGTPIAVSAMPDIMSQLESRQEARKSLAKPIGNKRHK